MWRKGFRLCATLRLREWHGPAETVPLPIRVLDSAVPQYLGRVSYSLYLVHFPLLSLIHALLRPHIGSSPVDLRKTLLLLYAIGVPVSLLATHLFHLAFEKPYLVRRQRKFVSDPAEAAALSPRPTPDAAPARCD